MLNYRDPRIQSFRRAINLVILATVFRCGEGPIHLLAADQARVCVPLRSWVIRFRFTDLKKLSNWWLLVKGCNVDICLEDPGREADV